MNFLDIFSKILRQNFTKIRPVGAKLFHAEGRKEGRKEGRTDGRTDMTKLIVAFRNLVNKPKNKN
jgi:flagellar biosynthesis/type III secretory pathway protein FliH